MNNEPVAWMCPTGLEYKQRATDFMYNDALYDKKLNWIPLYTHPVKEQLTDEEIDSVVHELRQKSFDPKRWLDVYTVAIETIIQLRDELRKAQEK